MPTPLLALALIAALASPLSPLSGDALDCEGVLALADRLGSAARGVSALIDQACGDEGDGWEASPRAGETGDAHRGAFDARCLRVADAARDLPATALVPLLRAPDPSCPDLSQTMRRTIEGKSLAQRTRVSGYGYRVHPILHRRKLHTGIDLSAKKGEAVAAHASGQVVWAGSRYGYGLAVELQHSEGYSTLYAHLSRIDVKPGDIALEGQRIGLAGSTGLSTNPHIHLEVRLYGRPVDPSPFLDAPARLYGGPR